MRDRRPKVISQTGQLPSPKSPAYALTQLTTSHHQPARKGRGVHTPEMITLTWKPLGKTVHVKDSQVTQQKSKLWGPLKESLAINREKKWDSEPVPFHYNHL